MSAIELVTASSTTKIYELSEAVWQNEEPGFQIEGARSVESLYLLLEAIKYTAPVRERRHIRFNAATLVRNDTNRSNACTDEGFVGLAVHQNLFGEGPVKLSLPDPIDWQHYLESGMNKMDFVTGEVKLDYDAMFTDRIRSGVTDVGRLTVFSEGNLHRRDRPFPGLRPTMHHFVSPVNKPASWNCYSTAPILSLPGMISGLSSKSTVFGKGRVISAAIDAFDALKVSA